MVVSVKICGLKSKEVVDVAVRNGVTYAGFVFYPSSPRHVTISECVHLTDEIPKNVKIVAVTVDPTNKFLVSLSRLLKPDYIQLHGSESPNRTREIRDLTKTKIIKAISIEDKSDLDVGMNFLKSVDSLLFDTKPPKGKSFLPGGNALKFDWKILSYQEKLLGKINWFLSGGLNIDNISEAINITGAKTIDISSGVESSLGKKDPNKIKDFMKFINALNSGDVYERN